MTQIKSGWFNPGSNTPTGDRMKVAVDNPYITKEEFVQSFEAAGLGITENSPQYASGELDRKIMQASAWINRLCGRYFDTQTIDETKRGVIVRPTNPELVSVVLKNRPYSRINSIYIQVLKWFIQIDISATGYLQDFYDYGFYRIVPLLSVAGTGAGSPLPAAIVDHVHLGVIWTNYTFGFGTPLTAEPLAQIAETKQYQVELAKRLWAPSQTTNVYDAGALVGTDQYTVDYPNGLVTFVDSYTVTGAVTADFTTNQSLPFEVKEACILLVCHMIGQATQNPLGAKSLGIQTFNINFGDSSSVEARVEKILEPYNLNKMPSFLGF